MDNQKDSEFMTCPDCGGTQFLILVTLIPGVGDAAVVKKSDPPQYKCGNCQGVYEVAGSRLRFAQISGR